VDVIVRINAKEEKEQAEKKAGEEAKPSGVSVSVARVYFSVDSGTTTPSSQRQASNPTDSMILVPASVLPAKDVSTHHLHQHHLGHSCPPPAAFPSLQDLGGVGKSTKQLLSHLVPLLSSRSLVLSLFLRLLTTVQEACLSRSAVAQRNSLLHTPPPGGVVVCAGTG
jgi:hypothetical protein